MRTLLLAVCGVVLIAGCPVTREDGTGQAAPEVAGGNQVGFAPGATIFSPGGAVRSGGTAGGINVPIGYGPGPMEDLFGIFRGPFVSFMDESSGGFIGGPFVDRPRVNGLTGDGPGNNDLFDPTGVGTGGFDDQRGFGGVQDTPATGGVPGTGGPGDADPTGGVPGDEPADDGGPTGGVPGSDGTNDGDAMGGTPGTDPP